MKKKLNCLLLVDDDNATNYLNKKIVQQVECTQHVVVASSGQQALDYLTNSGDYTIHGEKYPQPDLIFLDLNMPAMNGWEFLEKYRQLPAGQKARVIMVMLTTSLNPDDQTKAHKTPEIKGFMNKPLTREMLVSILQNSFPDHF
jgi:CheY-like chemotaxis protein